MRCLVLCSILLLLFGSCTIEKRLYRKGFHIERRSVHRASGQPDSGSPAVVTSEDRFASPAEIAVTADSLPAINHFTSSIADQQLPPAELHQQRLSVAIDASNPPNDDSTVVAAESLVKESEMERAMRHHELENIVIAIVFVLAVLGLILIAWFTFLEADILGVFFLLFLLVMLLLLGFILIVARSHNRPDRKQKRKAEKEKAAKLEEEQLSPEELEERKKRKHIKATAVFIFILTIVGCVFAAIYLN